MSKKIIILGFIFSIFISGIAYSAQKDVLLKTTKTWDNDSYKKLNIKKPEVTVLKITMQPGEVLPLHKHDITNVAYLEEGTLMVVTDKNEQITLNEGDCLAEIVGKYHYGKNIGKTPVTIIVFYVGEKGSPLSTDKK